MTVKNSKSRKIYHKGLASGRWQKLTFFEQMANIGSEVFRMIKWKNRHQKNYQNAFERALELLDLTMADPKNRKRLKEIARVREVLVDTYFDNQYQSSEKQWYNYFYSFNYAARVGLVK